ncbi:MAG: FISUMP domain-containing protein [Niabella sp.]
MAAELLLQACTAGKIMTDDRGNNFMKDKRDGHLYRVANMNGQWWMIDNFNLDIPEAKWYLNDAGKYQHMGRVYHWQQAQNTAPKGWRLPTYKELAALFLKYGPVAYSGELTTFKNLFGNYNPDSSLLTCQKLQQDTLLNLPFINDTLNWNREIVDGDEFRTLLWSADTADYGAYAVYWKKGNGVFFSEYPKKFYGFVRYVKAASPNVRSHKIKHKERNVLKKEREKATFNRHLFE